MLYCYSVNYNVIHAYLTDIIVKYYCFDLRENKRFILKSQRQRSDFWFSVSLS